MEDILDVYQRPYDPLRPVVGLDEAKRQLIEKRSIPAKPGSLEREDYEYRRCGVADLSVHRLRCNLDVGEQAAVAVPEGPALQGAALGVVEVELRVHIAQGGVVVSKDQTTVPAAASASSRVRSTGRPSRKVRASHKLI